MFRFQKLFFLSVLTVSLGVLVFLTFLNDKQNRSILKRLKITQIGAKNKISFTTVVTTMFSLKKSKHTSKEYEIWIERFIKSIGAPIVAFVDTFWHDKFTNSCKKHNLTAIIFVADSIWNLMRELEISRGKIYIPFYRHQQKHLDPEQSIHSPELYAIWNLKHYFIHTTATENPFKSNFFLFTDSGAWRGQSFTNWPDESFVRKLSESLGDKILYGQISKSHESKEFPRLDVIQAALIAGTKKAIQISFENYYNLHDDLLMKGDFVGKEQNLMNLLSFGNNTQKNVARLKTFELNCTQKYDKWFFYQYFFASESEYICREDRFSLIM